MREAAEREEFGDFELRKKPLDSSPADAGASADGEAGSVGGGPTHMPVPRSLILTQNLSPFQAGSASSNTPRPQLYEDDENSNSRLAAATSDTNSNLDPAAASANTSAASQPSDEANVKSNDDSHNDPDSQP